MTTTGIASVSSAPTAHATSPLYYVSLGDSYSVGWQPGSGATTHGYANVVVNKVKRALGLQYQLMNYGCAGATTSSILNSVGCGLPAVNGAPYNGLTQAGAAEAFIAAHPGEIALITVSIGGNDITGCASPTAPADCLTQSLATAGTNMRQLTADLRAVAGPTVPIMGLTYPDVILGNWVRPPFDHNSAALSVTGFQLLINPAFQSAYASAGATFVDVTAGSGAYTPLTKLANTKPYGRIPVAVAKVCHLTWYCAVGDIHARNSGYALIAKLIVAGL